MASNYQNFQFNGQNGTNNQPIGQNINPIPNFQPNYFFPQPIGNVYSLNSSADIANIPIGANYPKTYGKNKEDVILLYPIILTRDLLKEYLCV